MSFGRAALILAAAVALAVPQSANAATLCVNKVGAQCDQLFTAAQLDDAFAVAGSNQTSPDRVEIGPGIYSDGPYNAASEIDIVGAGPTQTIITNTAPLFIDSSVLLVNFGTPTVSDLGVRIGPGESSRGLQVGGGTVERVRVDAAPGSDPGVGLDAFGVTVRRVEVVMPREPFVTGAAGGGTWEDSTFEGGTGLFFGGGTARRIVARGNTALSTRGSRIEDSLLEARGPDAEGISLGQFDGGTVDLSHLTVVGDGSAGSVGLRAEKGSGAFASLTSRLNVRNTVVTGFATDLVHRGHVGVNPASCGTNCPIAQFTDVAYSALDLPERVSDLGGPGALTVGPGNVDLGDPRFADAAARDYRLRHDSPLVDAGDPVGLGGDPFHFGESPVDLGGLQRVVDGLPGGSPPERRDIGAHEYARRAPTVSLGAPGQAVLYRPVTLAANASDPDPFDPVGFRFSFDGTDTGANATHVFTTLGTHTARVVATDPTGGAASAETTFTVTALSGRCKNVRVGGAGRDVFSGTAASESLSGGAGRDSLSGGGGADCLSGGAAADKLSGGAAADSLNGGSGADALNGGAGADSLNGAAAADKLTGGKGKDKLKGGAGRDTILARDKTRDRVDCGPGRDKVVADRKDKLRRCEAVRRR